MQRLFSTFPNGRPGCGLLLLRLVCGAALLIIGTSSIWRAPLDSLFWIGLVCCLTGALLLAGLWTPLAASCHAILSGGFAWMGGQYAATYLVLALIGVSLTLLGPGAWSIDARLYGRKRIDLDHH